MRPRRVVGPTALERSVGWCDVSREILKIGCVLVTGAVVALALVYALLVVPYQHERAERARERIDYHERRIGELERQLQRSEERLDETRERAREATETARRLRADLDEAEQRARDAQEGERIARERADADRERVIEREERATEARERAIAAEREAARLRELTNELAQQVESDRAAIRDAFDAIERGEAVLRRIRQ